MAVSSGYLSATWDIKSIRSLKATRPESAEDGLCKNRSRTGSLGLGQPCLTCKKWTMPTSLILLILVVEIISIGCRVPFQLVAQCSMICINLFQCADFSFDHDCSDSCMLGVGAGHRRDSRSLGTFLPRAVNQCGAFDLLAPPMGARARMVRARLQKFVALSSKLLILPPAARQRRQHTDLRPLPNHKNHLKCVSRSAKGAATSGAIDGGCEEFGY